MDTNVDRFLKRAPRWKQEMTKLREIALNCGLDEELKWGKPCFTHAGRNIAILQPFKERCGFMFFKGALLRDSGGLLEAPGPNSQSARRLMVRSVKEIEQVEPKVRALIRAAIQVEDAGLQVPAAKAPEPRPPELEEVFRNNPELKKAFEALTPGRQRGYLLHFSGAKMSATRRSRIAKCAPMILQGKGRQD